MQMFETHRKQSVYLLTSIQQPTLFQQAAGLSICCWCLHTDRYDSVKFSSCWTRWPPSIA